MRAPLLLALATVLALLGCNDGGRESTAPAGTATLSPTPQSSLEPQEKESPLSLKPDWTNDSPAITWRNVDGESSYRVEGTATWWPGCDTPPGLAPSVVPFAEELAPDTTRYAFPTAPDKRLSILKEFTASVRATGSIGTIAEDGMAYTGEIGCPSD